MLYFEAPYLNIEGLTIFRDHALDRQFYYYPAAPQLARHADGSPVFLFLKYREDLTELPEGSEPGGGFLSFDVDLRVEEERLDEVRRQLKRDFDLEEDPILAPLDYRDGTVRLIFLDHVKPDEDAEEEDEEEEEEVDPLAQPPFVVAAQYGRRPSLFGDNRAAFSVQLSSRGATLVEESLDMKSSLIGVVYDLSFVGMRPAYDISLEIDWERVYEHLEENYHADFLFVNSDISNIVDKLKEEQAIRIDVIRFGAGESDADIEARADEATMFVQEFVTEKFFEPSLNPHEAVSNKWYNDLSKSAKSFRPMSYSYSKQSMERFDAKSLNVNLRERSAMERRIAPQGHLQGLMEVLKELPREAYIREVDLADPFFATVEVQLEAAASIDTDQIDAISVHLEYGPEDDPIPRTVVLRSSGRTDTVRWNLDPEVGLSYRYRYEVVFGPGAPPGAARRLASPTYTTNETRLVIDPRDLYGVQEVKVEPVAIPWDRYPKVEVNLRYREPAHDLELTETMILRAPVEGQPPPTGSWRFRLSDPRRSTYEYRLTYYPAGGEPVEGDWIESFDPAVLVSDLYPNTLEVQVAPAGDFEEIRRIVVTMSYDDDENGIHERKTLTFQEDEIQTWTVHLVDNTKRSYTYQPIIQYRDGTVKRLPPIAGRDDFLFVGDVFERLAEVRVAAIGEAFERAGLSRIIVELNYEDDENGIHEAEEVVLRSVEDTFDWSFKIKDPSRDSYRYKVTYVQADGFRRREPERSANGTNVLIQT